MVIRPETTLRELANAGGAARQLLDRWGIDFCCSGERSLHEACVHAGLDEVALARALEALAPAKTHDWPHEGLCALLDHVLLRCHPETRRRLAEIQAVAKGMTGQDARTRALREAVDDLVVHATLQMKQEETEYFTHARALADARKGRGPFPSTPPRTIHEHERQLREGHARIHEDLRHVRALVDALKGEGTGEIWHAIEDVAGALEEQMHLENNELLPRARDLEPATHHVP